MADKNKGMVYVLTNPSLDNMVKIGHTTRSAEIRAKELSTTGLPTPFEVAFESEPIENFKEIERSVHQMHKTNRVSNGREFFEITPEIAINSIKKCIQESNTPAAAENSSAPTVITVKIPHNVDSVVLQFERLDVRDS